jgi:predicted nucleic-acid-binding protein
MFVLDTNILVRFAVNDDVGRVAQARRAIGTQAMWVSVTVLLELEWVLRSRYGYERKDIHTFLTHLLETANVNVEDETQAATALDWYSDGSDFADALHLARTQSRGVMLTVDALFCKSAQRTGAKIKVLRAAVK